MTKRVFTLGGAVVLTLALCAGCRSQGESTAKAIAPQPQPAPAPTPARALRPSTEMELAGIAMLDSLQHLPGDLALLPAVQEPADNVSTPEKVELGKWLFFDKRLSGDGSMSCATCHDPELGWADGRARAIGWDGQELGRHSPTIINSAFNGTQFWDGRAASLEEQAVIPIFAEGEMRMASEEELLERLSSVPEYVERFEAAFGEGPSLDNVGKALAAFERTVVTTDSPFDAYVAGDKDALDEAEKRGLLLFVGKASCTSCHSGPNFTDDAFHRLGVPQEGPASEDLGRFDVTSDDADLGAFKTPTLRNVAETAPYMHDGSQATLEEVVAFYNRGGDQDASSRSELIFPLGLSPEEEEDLVAFLHALSGRLPSVEVPILP